MGNLLEVPAGSVLLCEGDWKLDKKYGRQFLCQSWEEVMPATAYGIEKYLGSGLVKGIGPKFAQLIVSRFGLETIDVIETDIERLYEVPGIGKKRVEKIAESWEKQKTQECDALSCKAMESAPHTQPKFTGNTGKKVLIQSKPILTN